MEIVTNIDIRDKHKKTWLEGIAERYHAMLSEVENNLSLIVPRYSNHKEVYSNLEDFIENLQFSFGLEVLRVYK